MEIAIPLVVILALSLVLIKSSDWVVVSVKRIARDLNISSVVVATLIVALATSLPEFFIGVAAALSGNPSLSLGNVVGANVANLSLVLGLAGVLGGVVFLHDEQFLKRDLPLVFLAGLAPVFLFWDRQLSRIDGLILLVLYGAYVSGLFRARFFHRDRVGGEEALHRLLRQVEVGDGSIRRDMVRFFLSLGLLIFSADLVVKVSSGLAVSLGVPLFLVGLLILSVGTTLPELVFSYRSIKVHAPTILLGNLLGSVVVNSTLIIGVVSLLSPFKVSARREYLLAVVAFVVLLLLIWIFVHTKRRLERWEAGVLFLVYVVFVYFSLLWGPS